MTQSASENFEKESAIEIITPQKTDHRAKVSVIIPIYNASEYLPICLNSLVNQTLKDIEIICIDDGSTDNSLDILKEYAQRDSRFQIIKQKKQRLCRSQKHCSKICLRRIYRFYGF